MNSTLIDNSRHHVIEITEYIIVFLYSVWQRKYYIYVIYIVL